MMMKVNWRPDGHELRKFGVALLIGLGIVGSIFYFLIENQTIAKFLWGFGLLGGLAGLTGTIIAKPFYYVWMGFTYTMSTVLGFVIFYSVYFLLITPMGILARVSGRDKLTLNKPVTQSYWIDIPKRPKSEKYYERQY